VAVAWYITVSPRQEGLAEGVTVTDTEVCGNILTIIALDVAGFPTTHGRLDVTLQTIVSGAVGAYEKIG
jgi:hypothetical protein